VQAGAAYRVDEGQMYVGLVAALPIRLAWAT
jgi:hypothetical protein